MNEKPIERLNYFNGQRLQAADFSLEQDYHIRVRRWLNRSLHGPGIADGLYIVKVEGKAKVRVSPGLALDAVGREIILLEERELDVPAMHGADNRPLPLYLTIRYAEERISQQNMSCAVGSTGQKTAWGGPARVLAESVFDWSDELPHEGSGKVLLACVTLAKNCTEIGDLDTGVRGYVGEGSASRVKQYALEGVRDIDERNKGVIRFHIRGRQPSAVTLYLRSEAFPSYFYTELGKHNHSVAVDFEPHTVPAHAHALDAVVSSSDGGHEHRFAANTGGWFPNGELINSNRADALDVCYKLTGGGGITGRHTLTVLSDAGGSLGKIARVDQGGHSHGFAAGTATATEPAVTLPHVKTATSSPNTGDAGVDTPARSGAPLAYVEEMQIELHSGGRIWVLTDAALQQLGRGAAAWLNKKFGDGTSGHVFASADGAPAIRIDLLPDISIGEGAYEIHLIAPSGLANPNGGRVHFNLYIE